MALIECLLRDCEKSNFFILDSQNININFFTFVVF